MAYSLKVFLRKFRGQRVNILIFYQNGITFTYRELPYYPFHIPRAKWQFSLPFYIL